MRRTTILIALTVSVALVVWWSLREVDPSGADGRPSARPVAGSDSPPKPASLDSATVSDSVRETALPSPSDAADSRTVAAAPAAIAAAHARVPDEPTLIVGRVVDRSGTPQVDCRVLAAPRVAQVVPGLKSARAWPLDWAPIDRDGARARARDGQRDPDVDRDDELARVRETTTDAEGHFEIRGVPSGAVRIAVRSRALAPRDFDDLVVPARDSLDIGDVPLDPALVLEGQVVDAAGRAIAGARIDRVESFDAHVPLPGPAVIAQIATTAADGRFRTDPLATGAWSLLASAADHVERRLDGAWHDASHAPPPIQFVLEPGAVLRGHVIGPNPVELATLCVLAAPTHTWREPSAVREGALSPDSPRVGLTADMRASRVDPDGHFELTGLHPERSYTLRVGPLTPGGDELACAYATAEFASSARDIEIPVTRGARVALEAHSRATGAPVEDFEVHLQGAAPDTLADPQGAIVLHHPNGRLRLEHVRFDSARVDGASVAELHLSIAALGHVRYEQTVFATPGIDLDFGTVSLEPLCTLTVDVLDDVSGAPLEGARVGASEIDPERSRRVGWTAAITDRSGRARVTSFGDQGSLVRVTAEGFASIEVRGPFERSASEPGNARRTVRLGRGARVRVHVVDRDGAPIAGVRVGASRSDPDPDVAWRPYGTPIATDRSGIATFENLPRDNFLFARAQLRRPPRNEWSVFSVGDGGESDVWIASGGVARLTGRIAEGTHPVVGAELTLRALDTDLWGRGRNVPLGDVGSARTDVAGAYAFDNLEPGAFELAVDVEGAVRPLTRECLVTAAGARLDVDLAEAVVRGRVVDARHHGVRAASVSLELDDDRTPWEFVYELRADRAIGVEFLNSLLRPTNATGRRTPIVETDADGRFEFFGVNPRDAFTLFATHGDSSCGSLSVSLHERTAAGDEPTVELAPAGSLELTVDGRERPGTCIAVFQLGDDVHGARVREVRLGAPTQWTALAPREWTIWILFVDQDGQTAHVDPRVHTVAIEAGVTTHATIGFE